MSCQLSPNANVSGLVMVEIKKFPSPVFIIYEHSKYIPKLWIISWSLSVSTIYCILILYSQLPIPAIGCRLDTCLDASCLPGRVYLIIVTVPWCHGGSGISGDTAEGRGMMREDEQSPRAGGSSGRCLVLSRTQFLGLRGKSPPLLPLSS